MWQHEAPKRGAPGEIGEGAREYVNVVADYMPDGTVRPVRVSFVNGPAFDVDRIIDVVDTSATKYKGAEIRYYVSVGDGYHYLFFEDAPRNRLPRWFVQDYGGMDMEYNGGI